MKIAVFHNYYQQLGGEDILFDDEKALLVGNGHKLKCMTRHNHEIGAKGRFNTAVATIWNKASYQAVKRLLEWQPQVAHFYNTFPLISPAAYYAARAMHVPVVQALQNYRLLCPGAFFLRDGRVCESCLGRLVPWPALARRCYRQSRAATAAVATMLAVHRVLKTWREVVDVYIAPTAFARQKFIEGGLPGERIVVKPNFIYTDPVPGDGKGGFALFVGRLSEEKGIKTMLAAWSRLDQSIPLKIVGAGPLEREVQDFMGRHPGLAYLGHQSVEEVLALMREAKVLVFPSEWYEGLPRTIIESLASGTPVIASRLGAMESVIEHGRTGLHFNPGKVEELAARVEWAFAHPMELELMRREARAEFEARYTAERNYQALMEVYQMAMERARVRRARG